MLLGIIWEIFSFKGFFFSPFFSFPFGFFFLIQRFLKKNCVLYVHNCVVYGCAGSQ